MKSPAQRHYMRTLAARRAAADAPERPASANAYELTLAQLAEHRRQLKQVQSIERKIEAKRLMLPDYAPWVEGVLKADNGGQDDVLMTVMIWRVDTGDLASALPIAEYALRHGLTMPDQYERTVACLITEEAAELALKQLANGEPADLAALTRIEAITAEADMPDEVRAKLCKAMGYALRDTDPTAALGHLRRAVDLNDKVGVKKDIERIEREMKNQAKATGQG